MTRPPTPTEAAERNIMNQFYALAADEERCLKSSIERRPITITGLNNEGKIRAFTGTIQTIEKGHTLYPNYPLRITISDSNWDSGLSKLGHSPRN